MSIDQLTRIANQIGLKDVTPLIEEHQTLHENYKPSEKALLIYMASKYIHGDTRNFVVWYCDHMDLFDKQYVKRMERRLIPVQLDGFSEAKQ